MLHGIEAEWAVRGNTKDVSFGTGFRRYREARAGPNHDGERGKINLHCKNQAEHTM